MGDPFKVPEHLIPPGMSWQWFSVHEEDQPQPDETWQPVKFGRVADHFGAFADSNGDVVVLENRLMERPKILNDEYNRQSIERAHKQEADKLKEIQDLVSVIGGTLKIKKSYG